MPKRPVPISFEQETIDRIDAVWQDPETAYSSRAEVVRDWVHMQLDTDDHELRV